MDLNLKVRKIQCLCRMRIVYMDTRWKKALCCVCEIEVSQLPFAVRDGTAKFLLKPGADCGQWSEADVLVTFCPPSTS